MKHRAIATAALAALAGCSSGPDDPGTPNPARLWLAPGQLEVDVLLVPEEPDPW